MPQRMQCLKSAVNFTYELSQTAGSTELLFRAMGVRALLHVARRRGRLLTMAELAGNSLGVDMSIM